MKRLIIMRHAKSSWSSGANTDHARPLNKRGMRDAPRMGDALRERGWVPELAISSDSQRTRETWAGVAAELGEHIVVTFTSALYHAGPREIAAELAELSDDIDTVIVLGHNPGWEDAVHYFSGVSTTMTTANCALLEADGAWDELAEADAWTFVEILRPKEL